MVIQGVVHLLIQEYVAFQNCIWERPHGKSAYDVSLLAAYHAKQVFSLCSFSPFSACRVKPAFLYIALERFWSVFLSHIAWFLIGWKIFLWPSIFLTHLSRKWVHRAKWIYVFPWLSITIIIQFLLSFFFFTINRSLFTINLSSI